MIIDIDLRPSIEEYELIWNNTSDAIFMIRHDGAIVRANPALTTMLGWHLTEILGYERPPFFTKSFIPEEHQKLLNRLKSGENIINVETQRKHRDGSVKDILASYRAINSEDILAVAMYKDMTEEKMAKRKLGIVESHYQALVDNTPNAVLLQHDNQIDYVNPAAVKLLGANNPDEIMGRSISDFIVWHQAGDQERFLEITQDNESVSKDPMITQLKRLDDSSIWIELMAMPIKYNNTIHIEVIIRDITVRKYYEDQLIYMVTHDLMTGAVNRSSLFTAIDRAIEQGGVLKQSFAVLYLDLDKFKDINDTYGHSVGDELLIEFVKRIDLNIREQDVLGRVGGDEFILLLNDLTKEQVEVIAKRMLANISKPYVINDIEIAITLSIGIAMFPEDGQQTNLLIQRADRALYHAKEMRDHYVFYD